MIYTTLDQLSRYLGLSKNMDTAIRHALENDLSQLKLGRNEIDGNETFVNVFAYETIPQEKAIWEGHANYGDLQIMLQGHEKIGISNAADLKVIVHNETDDFIGYEGPVQQWVHMDVGSVLIVFPEDVHLVKVMDGDVSNARRIVYKFKL